MAIVLAARASPAIHADFMVALDFYIVTGFSEKETILFRRARPSRLPLQKRALGAFPTSGEIVLFRTVVHPKYIKLDGARQLLFSDPLSSPAGVFVVTAYSPCGEPIGLIVPLPVPIGEAYIPGLVPCEVGLDPTDLFQFMDMPGNITPIIAMLAAGVDYGAVL